MKKCVFVLEDDDDLRELFAILLEEEMYHVKTYPNIKTFKASLHSEEHPDLIIMDVKLPDGNGMAICTEIKENQQTAHIPIIMVSAHYDFKTEKQSCRAEAFIAKPFDIDNLVQKVRQYS